MAGFVLETPNIGLVQLALVSLTKLYIKHWFKFIMGIVLSQMVFVSLICFFSSVNVLDVNILLIQSGRIKTHTANFLGLH